MKVKDKYDTHIIQYYVNFFLVLKNENNFSNISMHKNVS